MRFRCLRCRGNGLLGMHEFEADRRQCNRCGSTNHALVAVLVDVHYMPVDPAGAIFAGGNRHRVACQPRRETLGLSRYDTFNATADPRAVSCPSCKGTLAWRQAALAYPELRMLLGDGFKITSSGCCD